MSMFKKCLVAAVFMLTSGMAMANGKVVVLDLQSAILNTNAARAAFEQLEKRPEFTAMITKVESVQTDLRSLNASAEKEGMTWSSEEQADFRRRVNYLNADLEQELKKIQAERQSTAQRVVQELGPRVAGIIDQLMAAESISLVLNSQAAYNATEAADITAKVTDALNKAR